MSPSTPSLMWICDRATILCLQAPRFRLIVRETLLNCTLVAGDSHRPPTAGLNGPEEYCPPYSVPPIIHKVRVRRRRALCLRPLCTIGGFVHDFSLLPFLWPCQAWLKKSEPQVTQAT
jgi:hypothetical protein